MKLKLSTFSLGAVLLLTCVGTVVGQTTNLFNVPYLGSTNNPNGGGGGFGSGTNYSGAAILGSAGDTWNPEGIGYYFRSPSPYFNNVPLVNSSSNASSLTLSVAFYGGNPIQGQAWSGTPTDPATTNLMDASIYIFSVTGAGNPNFTTTHTIGGLSGYIGDTANLVVYAGAYTPQTEQIAITGGASGGNSGSTLTTTSASRKLSDGVGVAYNVFTNITITASNLVFTVGNSTAANFSNAGYVNGFQLQLITPSYPVIATEPVSQTNIANSTVQLSVASFGNAPLAYQWQAGPVGGPFTNLVNGLQSGSTISGATTNVLTIANITTNWALAYQVIVTNSFGAATSTPPATLTILTLPQITNQPVSVTSIAGQGASFSVGATGVGTLSYQWQATNSNGGGFTNLINGGHISGVNTTTLDIANVNTNWALSYQVIVTNANGAVTSSPASLAVLTPVSVVTNELINIDIKAGAVATQTGAAVLGAPGDVWNGVSTTTATIVDSASNVLSGVGYSLPSYWIFNDNTGGVATMDAATTNLMQDTVAGWAAQGYPTTTVSLTGLTNYINNPFTLVVYAAIGDANQGATLTLAGAAGGNTASTLLTTGASRSLTNTPPNGGLGVAYQTFTGILTNSTLSITASANLSQFYGINGFQLQFANQTFPDPSITVNPSSQSAFPGTNVSFSVTAAGSTPFTYQWQTNNGAGPFVNVGSNSIFSGTTSNVLTLTGVTTNQGLSYRVIVSNFNGSVTSAPATLTLLTLPVIVTQPASQGALLGQTVSFNVSASGVGPFAYQWQATNSATGGFTNLANGLIFSGVNTNVLTISGVTSNQSLAYRVVVSNSGGSVTSSPALLTLDSATRLIDVDLGTSAGVQSGAAVIGAAGDVWNGVAGATAASLVDSTSNNISNVQLVLGGFNYFSYNQPYGGGGTTPMDVGTTNLMQDFDFYFDGAGGHPNLTVSISNLTEYVNSPFALVVYGALGASQGDTLTLSGATGGNSASTLTTSADTRQLSAGIGHAYNIFTGTLTNSTLTITLNTNLNQFYGCNGFQLLLSPTLPLIITNSPVSQGASVGQPASFSVGVLGTAPFSYQWQATNSATGGFTNLVNGGVISGANTNILAISSVSTNWALAYRVIVTNSSQGSVTSSVVTLTVLPAPALVGEWFTGSQSLADQSGFTPAGTHDGVDDIGFNNAQWASGDAPVGHTGSSILFDGSYAVGITNSLNTDTNYKPTFDLTLSKKMTVAFWAKYTAPDIKPFVAKNGTSVGWQFQNDTTTTNPEFTLKGTSTANLQSTSNVTDGNWHHYAGTWDGTTGIRSVYIDGVLTANLTNDLGTMTTAGNYRLLLGGIDTVGTGDANINGPFFNGQLYDVRIYNYALSQAQVQALAGVTPTVSTNAYLSSLTVSPAGTLSPTFASNVFSYVTTEAYGNTPTITVVDADLTATNRLIYLGATNLLASGVASSALTLNSNPAVTNVVKVVVTAQDGLTTQSYLVNVVQLPSQTKPVLANSVSGGSLTLNWPLDHLGYRLLTQTNNLAKGVSANTNDWATVVGSSLTNTFTIPIVKTNLNQYYRLIYP